MRGTLASPFSSTSTLPVVGPSTAVVRVWVTPAWAPPPTCCSPSAHPFCSHTQPFLSTGFHEVLRTCYRSWHHFAGHQLSTSLIRKTGKGWNSQEWLFFFFSFFKAKTRWTTKKLLNKWEGNRGPLKSKSVDSFTLAPLKLTDNLKRKFLPPWTRLGWKAHGWASLSMVKQSEQDVGFTD